MSLDLTFIIVSTRWNVFGLTFDHCVYFCDRRLLFLSILVSVPKRWLTFQTTSKRKCGFETEMRESSGTLSPGFGCSFKCTRARYFVFIHRRFNYWSGNTALCWFVFAMTFCCCKLLSMHSSDLLSYKCIHPAIEIARCRKKPSIKPKREQRKVPFLFVFQFVFLTWCVTSLLV